MRLCGEPIPEDRAELMTVYQGLLAAGRIEFVTFHQSMSYEDFVEGRQPMTGADGDRWSGVCRFPAGNCPRDIQADREARRDQPRTVFGERHCHLEGRQVFKMSIGRANVEEDAQFFEEAIDGGYTLLGWAKIDWSDERYAEASEILETCQEEGKVPGPVRRSIRSSPAYGRFPEPYDRLETSSSSPREIASFVPSARSRASTNTGQDRKV